VVDAATGQPVPADWSTRDSARFLAREIPPCGYKTFLLATTLPSAPALPLTGESLETPFYRLTFHRTRGVVVSWIDKRTGRELVDARAPLGFGQYLYERFDRDQVQAFVDAYVKISADWGTNELGKPSLPPASEVPYRAASPTNVTCSIEQTDLATTLIAHASPSVHLPHGLTTKFVLYRDLPMVDVELTVHDKPFEPWPEAGWLCLPFQVDEAHFRLARLGSILDPARDLVPGCNFDQIALNGGLTVTGRDARGVGLCALDSPIVSLGEPGGWKYSKRWSPRHGRVFVNLFNNQWSTNFRLWNAGTWTSRVRLWPVAGDDLEAHLATPSDEARFPLVAAVSDAPAGPLPASQTGLELSRHGVKITAFGPNPDGAGTLLRLWEQAGQSGDCTVRLPSGLTPRTVQPVNLRGQRLGTPIAVKDRAFTAPLRPYAPHSFLVQ
jgi:hypothetical protein